MKAGSTLTDGDGRIETTGSTVLDDREGLAVIYEEEGGNVSAVARRLGYSKSHVRNILVELGIHEEIPRREFSLAARLESVEPDEIGLTGGRV